MNWLQRIRRSPTMKLVLWGAILTYEFLLLVYCLIIAVWAGGYMKQEFSGWTGTILSYATPIFIIITLFWVIYSLSKYSRAKLGSIRKIVKDRGNDKRNNHNNVEI